MRFLMIGDVVGRPGRKAVRENLPRMIDDYAVDFVLANGENASGGKGLTPAVADELFGYGIDVLTMGNHVWNKKEILGIIDTEPRLIRPANYPPGTPGVGFAVYTDGRGVRVGVANISGRVFMPALDCPFRVINDILPRLLRETKIVVVDFHAEATSEKVAMGWYLDGRASAVLGTHTHVQTADERILPGGTAFITDVGMTGPRESVIGVKKQPVIERFILQMPRRFEVASGPYQLNAVLVETDDESGRAMMIQRLFMLEQQNST